MTIRYWNRAKKCEEVEKVYGENLIQWLYCDPKGQRLADSFLSGRLVSTIYGAYQSSPLSRHKIEPFIRNFSIPMEEYAAGRFASFNDFFIRKFKPGARNFATDPKALPAFAEARYFAYEAVTAAQNLPLKGIHLSPEQLLGGPQKAAPFIGGPLLLARLCPVDYHRFHYPDTGATLARYRLGGRLHSVNPAALKYRPDILVTNERQVSILQTERFGKLAYVEVGALCVGKIVQSHPIADTFRRGDEKGYFLFGGSTVIVVGEPGAWRPDQDLLDETERGRETLVRLGEGIARATHPTV